MRTITKIDAVKLAQGLQQILLDMYKKDSDKEPQMPIAWLEHLVMSNHRVSRSEAERVSEAVINTGILRWSLSDNALVL